MIDIGGAVGFLGEALFVGLVIVAASLLYIGRQLSKINESIGKSKTREEK